MSGYQNNSIFWIETEKIQPNPYQPRREFEPKALEDLADSIRQYGILQPLVVTRKEMPMQDGQHGMRVSYELIAGERRLRASKIAGLNQVPVIIRKETDGKIKLELAIIENLQREDLNPIDRALAFEQLYKEFKLTHAQIGKKMGKSRVYVSNTLRLLSLPEDMRQGLMNGRITEGHTRPLLMLSDKPEEQLTLYKEIMLRKMSVRESERVARKIAQDKVRKKEFIVDPKIRDYEKRLSENLGTRVHIEPKEKGGKITIDYFTLKDLDSIISALKTTDDTNTHRMMDNFLESQQKDTQDTSESLSIAQIGNAVGLELKPEIADEPHDIIAFHKALPEFHHDKNEEIEVYKQEISAPESTQEYIKPAVEILLVPEITQPAVAKKTLDEMIADLDTDFYKTSAPVATEEKSIPEIETAPLLNRETIDILAIDSTQDIRNILDDDVVETEKSQENSITEMKLKFAPETVSSETFDSIPVVQNSSEPLASEELEDVAEPQDLAYYQAPETQTQQYQQGYTQIEQQEVDTNPEEEIEQPLVHHTYTGPYHNPQAGGHLKKKSFFGNLFK